MTKYLESKSKDVRFTSDPQEPNASKVYIINERIKFHQPDEEVDEFLFEFKNEILCDNDGEYFIIKKMKVLLNLLEEFNQKNWVYIPSKEVIEAEACLQRKYDQFYSDVMTKFQVMRFNHTFNMLEIKINKLYENV